MNKEFSGYEEASFVSIFQIPNKIKYCSHSSKDDFVQIALSIEIFLGIAFILNAFNLINGINRICAWLRKNNLTEISHLNIIWVGENKADPGVTPKKASKMLFWSNASWSWATQVVKVKHDNRERYIHSWCAFTQPKSSWCIYANQHFEMRSWELHWVSSVLFSPKLAMLHQLNCKQQSVLILRSRDSFYYILKHSIFFLILSFELQKTYLKFLHVQKPGNVFYNFQTDRKNTFCFPHFIRQFFVFIFRGITRFYQRLIWFIFLLWLW